MLNVGVDSYVSLDDGNKIAAAVSLSSDPAYKAWLELSDSDKEVLLRNSCRAIDNLKFTGRRRNVSQTLEFPRVDSSVCGIGYRLYTGQLYDNGLYGAYGSSDGGLALVKQAQVVNAIYAGYYNNLSVEQIGVNIQGLTSKKAGPIAESYDKSSRNKTSGSISDSDTLRGIFTPQVYSLLTPWLDDTRISY